MVKFSGFRCSPLSFNVIRSGDIDEIACAVFVGAAR